MPKAIDDMTYDELAEQVRATPTWAVAKLSILNARVTELETGIQDIAQLLKIDLDPEDSQHVQDFMADRV